MLYPDATSAIAADRIRRYRAEADAWRLVRLARAARAARAARQSSRPTSRAAPGRTTAPRRTAENRG
jgi:hypothetical protein